ncbi:chemotaxis protein CheW [Azospirillum rugosum]|uniref:Purine-binding chemotaxis protein CheW n=1 Tax=Azospirillum rugosum TaxID=416170 RepID=A0ABS4SGK9_9PROT|nr:chemotaxis protein CheW [Azospirillum rugosum]MBP2291334.1 purine-binding chemotaxis protein CheW [Azospirillum rugosum]MDQ0525122.1 purine-binding chemotaxis protein CheW [Azospirillum rugosum]
MAAIMGAAIMRKDGGRSFVTFVLGGTSLAVPMDEVLEILRPPEVVRVPLGPASLEGLARRRGVVLPVISLRRILGVDDPDGEGRDGDRRDVGGRLLVVRHRGQPVGLLVDRMTGLSSVTEGRIAAVDEAAEGDIEEAFLAGVIRATAGQAGAGQAGAGQAGALILDTGPVIERQFADLGRIGGGGLALGEAPRPSSATVEAVDEERLVVFDVAGQDFALPVAAVQEIVGFPEAVTRVPRVRSHLLGVTSLRDTLLPLVGLRELFQLTEGGEGSRGTRVVVVRTAEGLVGVVVDGVHEILRISRGRIDPVPALLAREAEFEDVAGIARADGGRLISILSADRLFRHGAALGTGTRGVDMGGKDGDGKSGVGTVRTEAFVVFRLAGAEYGLPVAAVQEVLRRPDAPTPLPNAPDFVRGVMPLRGGVLPLIDQRRLLRLPEGGEGAQARVVVIAAGSARAGLLVDGMTGIVNVPEDRIDAAPVVSQAQSRLIRRVAALDDASLRQGEAAEGRRMILLMDPQELLDMDQLTALLAVA